MRWKHVFLYDFLDFELQNDEKFSHVLGQSFDSSSNTIFLGSAPAIDTIKKHFDIFHVGR